VQGKTVDPDSRLAYHRDMAKVINLLARMGLVYADNPTVPEPAVAEPEPPADKTAARLVPPPAGGAPGALPNPGPPIAPTRLDPALAATVDGKAGDDYPFDQIYASAGIHDPAHGFTVYKLIEMMEADELRGLDDATRAKVLGGMLRRLPSGPVSLDDIVSDAVRRDQALDAFERFLADRVARVGRDLEEKNSALQAEIDELVRRNSEQMEANRAKIGAERERFERWQRRKRAEEERLFAAVQPFAASNPVTRSATGDDPPQASPAAGPEGPPA
jgi:hypothetical protein